MSELRVYIANCVIGGNSGTVSEDGSWSRNTVNFSCAGYNFKMIQQPFVVKSLPDDLNGEFHKTSEIVVENLQAAELESTLRVVEKLCWLLSFASGSRVVPYGHSHMGNSIYHSTSGVVNYFRPVFHIRDGKTVKSFVDQVFANYASLEAPRDLNRVVDYLVSAEQPNQALEVKLILSFVILESLKYTFATSKGFTYKNGYFYSGNTRLVFMKLVEMMLSDVGMTNNVSAIKNLRNELIHSGLSVLPPQDLSAMYEAIHDILREYFLRLVGYKGSYLTYSSASRVAATIQ